MNPKDHVHLYSQIAGRLLQPSYCVVCSYCLFTQTGAMFTPTYYTCCFEFVMIIIISVGSRLHFSISLKLGVTTQLPLENEMWIYAQNNEGPLIDGIQLFTLLFLCLVHCWWNHVLLQRWHKIQVAWNPEPIHGAQLSWEVACSCSGLGKNNK